LVDIGKVRELHIIKAEVNVVWNVLADMESWPSWAPSARNRIVYHPVIVRNGNVIICEEILQTAGIFRTKHLDKYILFPNERIEEMILEGDLYGGFEMTISAHPDGTYVYVEASIAPKNLFLKLVDHLFERTLQYNFWEDFLG
jgi:hypothetical protein